MWVRHMHNGLSPKQKHIEFESAVSPPHASHFFIKMQQITPEIRSEIEEITRRAGHLWRYL